MREAAIVVVAMLLAALGFMLAMAIHPKPNRRAVAATGIQEETPVPAAPKISRLQTTPARVDPDSTSEAIHAWHRSEKDAIIHRVEILAPSEAENLCFRLNLIPRDEVFDKVNVKARLERYVDRLRTEAEMADIEAGFRDLADYR
jgi:hypothetical protein